MKKSWTVSEGEEEEDDDSATTQHTSKRRRKRSEGDVFIRSEKAEVEVEVFLVISYLAPTTELNYNTQPATAPFSWIEKLVNL